MAANGVLNEVWTTSSCSFLSCVVASWFVFQLPVVDVHVLVVTAVKRYVVIELAKRAELFRNMQGESILKSLLNGETDSLYADTKVSQGK